MFVSLIPTERIISANLAYPDQSTKRIKLYTKSMGSMVLDPAGLNYFTLFSGLFDEKDLRNRSRDTLSFRNGGTESFFPVSGQGIFEKSAFRHYWGSPINENAVIGDFGRYSIFFAASDASIIDLSILLAKYNFKRYVFNEAYTITMADVEESVLLCAEDAGIELCTLLEKRYNAHCSVEPQIITADQMDRPENILVASTSRELKDVADAACFSMDDYTEMTKLCESDPFEIPEAEMENPLKKFLKAFNLQNDIVFSILNGTFE